IAAQVGPIPCPPGWDEPEFAGLHQLEQTVLWCCSGALRDAGWWERRDGVRFGMVLGLGAEWLMVWDADATRGGDSIYRPQQNEEPLVHVARRKLRLDGPAISVSAACASGNYAIAQARRWLELGWVDVCLAGACDAAINPLGLAGFGN